MDTVENIEGICIPVSVSASLRSEFLQVDAERAR